MDDRYLPEDNNNNNAGGEASDSLYSYNCRDKEQCGATHEGDYYENRDHMSDQTEVSKTEGVENEKAVFADDTGEKQETEKRNETVSDGMAASDGTAGNGDFSYKTETGTPVMKDASQHVKKVKKSVIKRAWAKKGFGPAVAKCAVLAVVFGVVAGGVFQGVNYVGNSVNGQSQSAAVTSSTNGNSGNSVGQTNVSASSTTQDVSGIVSEVMPSIVAITNMSQSEYYNMFGQSQPYESESVGAGIIVAEDDDYLYIATNNHVVKGATTLTVGFADDSTATASIKGTDESTDLAVVSVEKSALSADTLSAIKVATLGDSSKLQVGDSAIAIGNALGYGQSVTTGVISALNREVTTTDSADGSSVTNELIQTDAAINPGNSGGALLNMNGEVIGINSVKYSDTDVEGMGYAIPMATAQPIIDELITREKVDESKSAHLGISGVDVSSEVSKTYNMPQGVYVIQVSQGSAAEAAGIVSGDIITKFDGHGINSMTSLQNQLSYYSAGTKVDVTLQRSENGKWVEKTISVTLGSKAS